MKCFGQKLHETFVWLCNIMYFVWCVQVHKIIQYEKTQRITLTEPVKLETMKQTIAQHKRQFAATGGCATG